MDDYKSFVYQIVENPLSFLPAKCIVHFRPHKEWDGTGYGFDWMREGDTKVFGDRQPYVNIVGKQYHNADTVRNRASVHIDDLVTDTNEYKGTFKKDYSLYQQLEKEYHPMLVVAKPIKPPLALPVYYCSWLSIFPKGKSETNTKATLRLYIEVIEEPDYLEFEENECFTISQMKITEDLSAGKPRFWNGGETITIECKKAINVPAAINIFACKKDEVKGVVVKKLAGRLWVWENADPRLREANILLVNVKTPLGVGNYNQMGGESIVGKYLPQALITPIVDTYEKGLDLSRDAEFRRRFVTFDNKYRLDGLHLTLYDKLMKDLEKNGEPADKYLDYCILFYIEGTPDEKCAASTDRMARLVTVFKLKTSEPYEININHELFHCIQLDHTFSNLTGYAGSNSSPNARYTYEVYKTENLMDYSHQKGEKCYTTWKWQWVIANDSVMDNTNSNIIRRR